MNIKEHLQFLILMIPTLLLLIAAIISLATPATGATPPATAAASTQDPFGDQEFVELDTEIGPVRTVYVR